MGDVAQPTHLAWSDWTPQNVSTHDQHAHAFAQTGTHLRIKTESLFVIASRGFGRELSSTKSFRPSLKSRRYTIDVSLSTGDEQCRRDYATYEYDRSPEDLTYPMQSTAKMGVTVRETDEPVQFQTQLIVPDPLRYRELHRWGRVMPHFDENRYPGIDGERRFMMDTYARFIDGPLMNEDYMTVTSTTSESWYRDDVMDAALALCSIYYKGEENGIKVVGSATTQVLNFAAMGELDMNELQAYAPAFEGKKWIFMPLNNGIGGTTLGQFEGSHWSLLAIDRPNRAAHYIDGMKDSGMDKMASRYARALQKMLDDEEYNFFIECHAPGQWNDNGARVDWGPCGPYVLAIIRIMMSRIRDFQIAGHEEDVALHIEPDFRSRFGFDSHDERRSLEYTIASYKADQVAEQRAMIHAQTVLGLSRPLARVEEKEFTWAAYDAPLFTRDSRKCLTWRKVREYVERSRSQLQRRESGQSGSSSSSSGGITIISDTHDIHHGLKPLGADDGDCLEDVEMRDEPLSAAANDSEDVRIEEIFDDDDDDNGNQTSPYWPISIEAQQSSGLEASSLPVYNASKDSED